MTMQRVIISNYDEYGDPTEGVGISSNSMTPIDVQSRLQTTIQTHNAVSVAATTGTSDSSWIDTDGFNELAITLMNDATTNSSADLYWSHDGSSIHGVEANFIPSDGIQKKVANTITKARYMKLHIFNTDAASHTMSAWAYLKC
jgi:hypothetical protein